MKVKTTFIILLVQFLYGNGNPYFQQMVKYEIDVMEMEIHTSNKW